MDGEVVRFAGGDLDAEAVEGVGRLQRLLGLDELPALAQRVLDDERLGTVLALVLGDILLREDVLALDVEDALVDPAAEDAVLLAVLRRVDEHLEVDAIAEQALLVGREVVDA